MTTKISELLDAAAREALPVVRGVADDRLGDPTPCGEYAVRDLLNHLLHVVIEFQSLAAKKNADFSSTPDYLAEDGDWRGRFGEETARLVAAWGEPGADEGVTGLHDLPATMVGNMVLLDLTVHAWDLARATGQGFTPDAAGVSALAEPVAEMAPMARNAGVFGEPFPVRGDASAMDTLLATTGRDPGWAPPVRER